MRETKYKVYSKKYNKIFDVLSIEFQRGLVTYYRSERVEYSNGDIVMEQGDFVEPLSDVVLLEYIGRKDKHGKEIYEGDIVKGFMATDYDEERWQVLEISWSEEGASFNACNSSFCFPLDGLEVIGSIYENPELLKS